ncbi:hypothetical protein L226DRAFT_536043 [Lentinus tigrinus ALCF2SS1-7]|uniref:uncharacterized protein n=1 Tax=Lentinus tigrinus ALCF2SS1-7 TaxID=1328758 RepID=UPI001165D290|nr:hypothetical protein L226DRAFT_536043 [Lentinus tigrinus ALCF2SS1-7]
MGLATPTLTGGKDNFPDIIASHMVTIKVDSPPNNPDARDARISHDSLPFLRLHAVLLPAPGLGQVIPPRRRRHQPKSMRTHASDPDEDDRHTHILTADECRVEFDPIYRHFT